MLNKGISFVAIAACLLPGSAMAGTSSWDAEVSANVGLFSEYSFRGIAQSDENPALQGGFDIEHASGLYAGVWASNVDFNDGDEAHLEVDLYAGYAGAIDKFSYDVGVIRYMYPGADSALNYDFWELALAAGYDFDVLALTASLNYSPEYFGESGDAEYYALAADVPIVDDLSMSAHVGHQNIDDEAAFGVPDYTDWSVGLTYTLDGFDFSVAYVDTDLEEPTECSDGCESRVIFGISKTF